MATLAIVNPRKRRRKGRKARRASRPVSIKRRKRRSSRRGSPVVRRRRSRGRSRALNLRGLVGNAQSMLKAAAPAAAGAVALDVIWAYLPIPDALKGGYVRHAAKAGGAVVLGMIAERVVGRDLGSKVGLGAMTVVIYNLLRDVVAQFAPTVALSGWADGSTDFQNFPGGIGYYGSAQDALSATPDYYGQDPLIAPSLGEYQMGEYQYE